MKDKKKKGNFLKDMSINEVSLVSSGANLGAHISLFKSDESVEELAKLSFNEVLSGMEFDEEIEELISKLWDRSEAIKGAMVSIIRDPGVAEKKSAIKESLNQFMTAMSGLVDGTDIIKGELDISPEETTELVKFFDENREGIISYNTNLTQGGFEMNELEKLQKKFDELQKEVEDTKTAHEAALKKAETIGKMDDDTKSYFNSLDEEGQTAFLEKDEKAWADEIAKSKDDDETFTAHGKTIRKSVVGEDMFDFMKAQQAEIETNQNIAKKEKEDREKAEFSKQAETVYKNLPGEPEVKGKVLKAMDSLPSEEKETLEVMLKAGNEAMDKSRVFDDIGSDLEPSEDSAEGKLNKLAKERAETTKESFAKAYTAVLQTEAGKELYEKSLEEKQSK